MVPGDIFLALWREASVWSPADRAQALHIATAKRAQIEVTLARDDGVSASEVLMTLLDKERKAGGRRHVGLVLAILKAVDKQFLAIHPRIGVTATSAAARPPLPDWLEAAEAERVLVGSYARADDLVLIPRGPLYRPFAPPEAQSAETMRDRFTALAVAKSVSTQEHRPIKVSIGVVGQSTVTGVRSPLSRGEERIAFLPIAKEEADLERNATVVGDEKFVSIEPAAGFDAAAALTAAVLAAGDVDIAIAPEFVIPQTASEAFAGAIAKSAGPRAKLTIAGSGNTVRDAAGQVWNEARTYNDFGTEIWRQRKVWPAGIAEWRANDFGLGPVGATALVFEATQADDQIVVKDIEGLGRCLILICQDLQTQPLANELIAQYEPDWIFVPILDVGVKIGRWMHTRAYDLSKISQTRFLIASSASMCFWGAKKPATLPAIGLAVGPESPATPAVGPSRAVLAAFLSHSTDQFVTIRWGHGVWDETVVKTAK